MIESTNLHSKYLLDLFKEFPLPVLIVDKSKHIVLANSEALSFFNTTNDELTSIFLSDSPHSTNDSSIEFLLSKINTATSTEVEFFCSKRQKWYEILVVRNNKSITQIIIKNIDKRKSIENKLFHFSKIVNEAPLSVVLTDTKGNIEYVNRSFTIQTGYSAQEVIGKNPKILKSSFHSASVYKQMWEKLTNGEEWSGEFYNRKKNGEHYWQEVLIAPLKTVQDETTHYIGFLKNISQQKKLENDLLSAKNFAEKANKAKSVFLSNMTHELKTPLNGILGFTELLKGQYYGSINEKQEQYLTETEFCANNLLTVINDLLDIAKIDSGSIELSFESVMLSNFIKTTLIMIRSDISNKNQTITQKLHDEQTSVKADKRKLRQIFINLFLTISAYAKNDSEIIISTEPDSYMAIVKISFCPIALKSSESKQFFKFFQRESEVLVEPCHNALRVDLLKKLIILHSGSIKITQPDDNKYTITLALPFSKPDKQNGSDLIKKENLEAEIEKVPQSKILVAEDDEVNITMLVSMLSMAGHNITVARNGFEAIDAVKSQDFDIVLMDVQMPELDGLQATEEIRSIKKYENLPIIAVTASSDSEIQRKSILAGCSAIISKPFNLQKLYSVLKAFLT